MTPAWAQRQAELVRDCIVSPDVFQHMVDRLRDFAMPYQHALETEAGQRHVALYLAGLLSLDFPKMFRAPLCGHGTQLFTVSGHEHRNLAGGLGKMQQCTVNFHL